jgi:hypothetical protein
MTQDEARDLFSDHYDGTLDPLTRARFEAVLDKDSELRAEYEAFSAVVAASHDEEPEIDLLEGVQQKLRVRSNGRFYGTRFSEGRGAHVLSAIVSVLTLVTIGIVCAYFVLSATVLP